MPHVNVHKVSQWQNQSKPTVMLFSHTSPCANPTSHNRGDCENDETRTDGFPIMPTEAK